MKKLVFNKPFISYSFFLIITLVGLFYGQKLALSHKNIRVWEWKNIGWMLVAFPFLFLLSSATLQFKTAIASSNFKTWGIPILIGLAFGLLDLIIIELILPHPVHQELPPYTQPFPYSIFLYFSGALEIEVFYRLIPITLVLAIASRINNGRQLNAAFWIIAVLTALREPIEQFPNGPNWFVIYALVSGFTMNLLQAYYFRKQSFIASLSIRLSHYFVWHILNGILIAAQLN